MKLADGSGISTETENKKIKLEVENLTKLDPSELVKLVESL